MNISGGSFHVTDTVYSKTVIPFWLLSCSSKVVETELSIITCIVYIVLTKQSTVSIYKPTYKAIYLISIINIFQSNIMVLNNIMEFFIETKHLFLYNLFDICCLNVS